MNKTNKNVVSSNTIVSGVPRLSNADVKPDIFFDNQNTPWLQVCRSGKLVQYRVSKRVAAELIAYGFSFQ